MCVPIIRSLPLSVIVCLSGFGGYLTYDNSVFTSVTVVVDGGTTSGKTDNNRSKY